MKSFDSILFTSGVYRCVELHSQDIPEMQHFFEANPEYFQITEGRPPLSNEAELEISDKPPEGWSYHKVWKLGIINEMNELIGVGDVCSDLLAHGVWHIGLFMIATARFGSGDARTLYQALEDWMKRSGARWLRLGVVKGNGRAERFWEKMGYVEMRSRNGVEMGELVNTVRTMMKPMAGGTKDEYLSLIERDQPE